MCTQKTEDLFIAGFGAFVDKTMLPYVNMVPSKRKNPCQDPKENCQSAFSFQHVLPLTENASEFESRVSQQGISANLDYAEGGFDAIMQAAICKVSVAEVLSTQSSITMRHLLARYLQPRCL